MLRDNDRRKMHDFRNLQVIPAADEIRRNALEDQIKTRLDCQEHFIARFLAETGYKIEDCELIEMREGFTTRWFMRRRSDR